MKQAALPGLKGAENMAAAADRPKERMATRFTVDVTEKDIARAKRNDSYICVVSQSVARARPAATNIETDTQTIRFSEHGKRFVYLTPYAVQGYVIAFDAGDPIQPFKFQLRNPIKVSQKRRTPKGASANAAATRARARVRQKARAAGLPLQDAAVVADVRQAAKAAYVEAAAQRPGPLSVGEAGRHAPPRVFRRKQRSYGHRLLRINQVDAEHSHE
jgi:hypothetical protein